MKLFREIKNKLINIKEELNLDRDGDIDPNFMDELEGDINNWILKIEQEEDKQPAIEENNIDEENLINDLDAEDDGFMHRVD